MSALSFFHPIVREWFERRFGCPTPAQEEGWPAIAAGRHALVCAPTGSGKTLAAFLVCLDRLLRQALAGALPDTTQVVYVSPLKALSNDVQKNLLAPLDEIRALAAEHGELLPEIRVQVRTGDTLAAERRKQAKHPPHILITTPESLYVLLTSRSGRKGLEAAHTLIVDEIHAVAGNKRGSHLALSMERLNALVGGQLTRIGLSATQRPLSEVARFLVGAGSPRAESDFARLTLPGELIPPLPAKQADGNACGTDDQPDCRIVEVGQSRQLDLSVWHPEQELGPIATQDIWAEALEAIARLSAEAPPGTTLVFVNTRRLAERVAFQLAERLGAEHVITHHGSLSRATRLEAENRLKRGDVKVCVATASLELGLDIGDIDLVCQIGSARAISTFLQRAGRSNHAVGGVPRAIAFPLTRDELLECSATLAAIAQGELDRLWIPPWPLDVLAQQVVAAVAAEDWPVDDLWALVRRAYPYRDLPRASFDAVLEILAEGVAGRTGRVQAYLHHDRVNGKVRARRSAALAALTNGGAIPENAAFEVVLEPTGTRVGTVDEDFAVESMAGDVFQLGNTSWQITRVEAGKVRVVDAQGAPPTIPFWVGEALARTFELSAMVSHVRDELTERLDNPEQAVRHAMEACRVARPVAEAMVAYLLEGRRVLGTVPTQKRIVAERFFDESGGMQLVIHAPFGGRINRAWGMALRKRFCRNFDFELQAAATDDGLTLSLGPQHSFPLEEIFTFLHSRTAKDVLMQAILQAPLFRVRWRHVATRALAVLRFAKGARVPPALQRMRSDDLLAHVFPAQVGCQDNRGIGDIEPPDHPLVFEALRDCLTEALDIDGLLEVLRGIERGDILTVARDTPQPSVFAHQLLNAMPYAFLDDAPLEERRARAVLLRRALPENSADLAQLDPEAIAAATLDAWPLIRNAEELHDALLTLTLLPSPPPNGQAIDARHVASLGAQDRAFWAVTPAGSRALVAAERVERVRLALPGVRVESVLRHDIEGMRGFPTDAASEPGQDTGETTSHHEGDAGTAGDREAGGEAAGAGEGGDRDAAVDALVRGWIECSGPLTLSDLASRTLLPDTDLTQALARLEATGIHLRGQFTPGREELEVCDRRILARIHRATVNRLRREIEPAPVSTYLRFLFEWQHATLRTRVGGIEGLAAVIDQLAGYEAPATAWERDILLLRVSDYSPELLDRLALGGEVVWGRFSRRDPSPGDPSSRRRAGLTRTVPLSLGRRLDLPWLLEPVPGLEPGLTSVAKAVMTHLHDRGASFTSELQAALGILGPELEDALGQLVAAGLVTSDGFSALRRLNPGSPERAATQSRWLRHRRFQASAGGRWALLSAIPLPFDDLLAERAAQFMRRYGILCREVLTREPLAPPWRLLLPLLRRAEARGEIRGGRFLEGLIGEQFALPEAVEALRAVRRAEPDDEPIRLSGADPLNLSGILTPGPRLVATASQDVFFHKGEYHPDVSGARHLRPRP